MNDTIAQALITIGAVGFTPDKPITFKSGILSPVYVDNRILPFHPLQWHQVIDGFRRLIERERLAFDTIAGVAVGGVPHSAALAYTLNAPSVFVRKEAKGHGKGKQVEGGDVNGRTVLLVEDLVTTGGSSLEGVGALRSEGAAVTDVLAIVSYGFPEAVAAFESADVRLHTLVDFETILQAALALERLTPEDADLIRAWMRDPHGW